MSQDIGTGLPGPGDTLCLSDSDAVKLWAMVFGIESEDLRVAVELAGPSYDELVEYLSNEWKAW